MRFAFKSIMKQKAKGDATLCASVAELLHQSRQGWAIQRQIRKGRNLFTHIGCLFGHMFQWQLRRTRRRPRLHVGIGRVRQNLHRVSIQRHGRLGEERPRRTTSSSSTHPRI